MYINMADQVDGESGSSGNKLCPGIIYLSKIPPFMKPSKIRNIFSQYGEVGRLYLQVEDPLARKKRKKLGGSARKKFTEGWVEFKDKAVAKAVARSLNNTVVGGKKRGYYHDDIWNIKYLPKFRWGHISEKLAYERAAREQRMRTEISQARKEADFYIENIEKRKVISAMEERKSKKRKKEDKDNGPEQDVEQELESMETVKKKFKQKKVIEEPAKKKQRSKQKNQKTLDDSRLSQSLLLKVFGVGKDES